MEDETRAILSDPSTMEEIRQGEEELLHGEVHDFFPPLTLISAVNSIVDDAERRMNDDDADRQIILEDLIAALRGLS